MLESPELVSSSCMPEPVAVLPLYVSVTLALHFYPECKIVNHLPKKALNSKARHETGPNLLNLCLQAA